MLRRLDIELNNQQRRVLSLAASRERITRNELVTALGASPQTVMRLVHSLQKLGLVCETPLRDGLRGQPLRKVSYQAGRLAVLGVAICENEIDVVVQDLSGYELCRIAKQGDYGEPQRALAELSYMVASLATKISSTTNFLQAGIAMQGLIIKPGHVVTSRGNPVAWTQVDLSKALFKITGLPALLQNDATALMAKYQMSEPQGCQNRFLVHLSTGIGGGALSDGQLLEGSRGNAGEIGSIIPESDYRPTTDQMLRVTGLKCWSDWPGLSKLDNDSRDHLQHWCSRAAKELEPAINAVIAILDVEEVIVTSAAPEEILRLMIDAMTIQLPGQSLLQAGLPASAILRPMLRVQSGVDLGAAAASLARFAAIPIAPVHKQHLVPQTPIRQ